jgi:hypothetical protein
MGVSQIGRHEKDGAIDVITLTIEKAVNWAGKARDEITKHLLQLFREVFAVKPLITCSTRFEPQLEHFTLRVS